MKTCVCVTYQPIGGPVNAMVGDTLLDAALENGIDIPHECGGNCACTTCLVYAAGDDSSLSRMQEVEAERLATAEHRRAGARLACQSLILGSGIVVTIPEDPNE